MKGERSMSASSQTLSFAGNNVTAGKKKDFFLHRWSRAPVLYERSFSFVKVNGQVKARRNIPSIVSTLRYERSLSSLSILQLSRYTACHFNSRQAIIVSCTRLISVFHQYYELGTTLSKKILCYIRISLPLSLRNVRRTYILYSNF